MAFEEVRGLTLLCEDGDLEMTWEPENDPKVLAMIEKKMNEGVRFFILKPVVGDILHARRKLTKMSDLKSRNIQIKDADIQALFSTGEVALFRTPMGGTIETDGIAKTPQQAVSTRTVGVRAFQGG